MSRWLTTTCIHTFAQQAFGVFWKVCNCLVLLGSGDAQGLRIFLVCPLCHFAFINSLLTLWCALGITTMKKVLQIKISNPKTWTAKISLRENPGKLIPSYSSKVLVSCVTLSCTALGDKCLSGWHLKNHYQGIAMSPTQWCPHLMTASVICWEHPTGTPGSQLTCPNAEVKWVWKALEHR